MKKLQSRIAFFLARKTRVAFYKLLSDQSIEGPALLLQATQTRGPGRILAGQNVVIGYFPSPHFFSTYTYLESRSPHAIIRIGCNTRINNGFVAICEDTSIDIGKNCLIGTQVEVVDSDFHSLYASVRKKKDRGASASVHIGNDVFIGSNVKIMKGVSIGAGAVIANGAVVVRDIPAQTLAAGVPATVVRQLNHEH
jgi:acetyltransferase-like isoleucine patch superfamily enzyme